MKTGIWHYLILGLGALFLCGCQSPKFVYPSPSPQLKPDGPTIVVAAIEDGRTNRSMDKVLAAGYFIDVQLALANELQSINLFSAVLTVTNSTTTPQSDFTLIPQINRLEWEIPEYDWLLTKSFMVGLFTGIIGGTIYMLTDVDVHGHSDVEIRLERTSNAEVLLAGEFNANVINRLKKGACDTPTTKSKMMVQAFQQSMALLKPALQQKLACLEATTPESVPDTSSAEPAASDGN